MIDSGFYRLIAESSAHTACRLRLLNIVLQNSNLQSNLFQIGLNIADKNSYKAIWIIELLAADYLHLLTPYLNEILEKFHLLTHQSALRGAARILYFVFDSDEIILDDQQQQQLITICMDWLIDDKKVVVKWCSMRILFGLSEQHFWIKNELKLILEKDYPTQTPGYQNAARKILKAI